MSDLPLEGLLVVDLATLVAAPVAGTFLADFGAEVIKVEQPLVGDPTRGVGIIPDGRHTMFINENRNKKTVTLDLRTPEGQELVRRMALKADVFIMNFRPGQAEQWNIGAEELMKINPALVVLLVSAYGQTGPYRTRGGFDRTASAFAGATHVTGWPDKPPVRSGYALIDYMTAYLGAFAIMMALYNRDVRGGGGEVIDLSLAEAAFRATESSLPEYSLNGTIRERTGNRNPLFVPADDFETADGRIVVINAGTDVLFKRLAQAMGRPDLITHEKFKNRLGRIVNQEELYQIIAKWAAGLDSGPMMELLDAAKVPADIMRNVADLAEDPHMLERESVFRFNDPGKGEMLVPGVVPKLAKRPGRIKHLGGRLGEHNEEIYQGLLGLSPEELAALKAKGVV